MSCPTCLRTDGARCIHCLRNSLILPPRPELARHDHVMWMSIMALVGLFVGAMIAEFLRAF